MNKPDDEHWFARYAILGPVYGVCGGTILPVLGNILGLLLGVPFGLFLGIIALGAARTSTTDVAARVRRVRVVLSAILVPFLAVWTITTVLNRAIWPSGAIMLGPTLLHTWLAGAPGPGQTWSGGANFA